MPTSPLIDLDYWLAEARARAMVALRRSIRAELEDNAKLAECYKINYKVWKILERHIQDHLDQYTRTISEDGELQDLQPAHPFNNEMYEAQMRCIELYIRAATIMELYPCEEEALGRVAGLWWDAAWQYGWAALNWERRDQQEAESAEEVARELAEQAEQGEAANDFEFELPPSVRPEPPKPPRPPAPADPGRLDLPPVPGNRA